MTKAAHIWDVRQAHARNRCVYTVTMQICIAVDIQTSIPMLLRLTYGKLIAREAFEHALRVTNNWCAIGGAKARLKFATNGIVDMVASVLQTSDTGAATHRIASSLLVRLCEEPVTRGKIKVSSLPAQLALGCVPRQQPINQPYRLGMGYVLYCHWSTNWWRTTARQTRRYVSFTGT